MMTPAAIGAMLDGLPSYEFDDEETAAPPKPREIPAAAAVEVHVAPTPPIVSDDVVLPEAAPQPVAVPAQAAEAKPAVPPEQPMPESSGPVFQTVVVAPDGEKAAAEPPAPKKGWWRR